MPIRFRCAYCNQLMGIARRKAGSIVRCPKCSGQVVVPDPAEGDVDDEEADAPAAVDSVQTNKALEDPELDRLLAGAAADVPATAAASTRGRSARPRPAPAPPPAPAPTPIDTPEPIGEIDVEPIELPAPIPVPAPAPAPAPLPKGAMVVNKAIAIGVVVVLLLLAGLTFVVGYLLGKRSTSVEPAAAARQCVPRLLARRAARALPRGDCIQINGRPGSTSRIADCGILTPRGDALACASG